MNKCLSSFHTYIQSRIQKITDVLSFLSKSSLPSYTFVHTSDQNNIGILFQLLPKIPYLKPTTEWHSIVTMDEYAKHIISPEELRYMDYTMHMENLRCTEFIHKGKVHKSQDSLLNFVRATTKGLGFAGLSSVPFQILHSLPIVYPYTDRKLNPKHLMEFCFIHLEEVYSQKYPSFWTGDNHTNENSNVLFQNIAIEKNSPEFLFVQRLFNKTVPEKETTVNFVSKTDDYFLDYSLFCLLD